MVHIKWKKTNTLPQIFNQKTNQGPAQLCLQASYSLYYDMNITMYNSAIAGVPSDLQCISNTDWSSPCFSQAWYPKQTLFLSKHRDQVPLGKTVSSEKPQKTDSQEGDSFWKCLYLAIWPALIYYIHMYTYVCVHTNIHTPSFKIKKNILSQGQKPQTYDEWTNSAPKCWGSNSAKTWGLLQK